MRKRALILGTNRLRHSDFCESIVIEESLTFRVGTEEEDLRSDFTKDQNLGGEEEMLLKNSDLE